MYTRGAVMLEELARRLDCRLEGDGTIVVTRVAGIDEAGPGDLTFLTNPKYANRLATTRASAIIADDSVLGAPCAVPSQQISVSGVCARGRPAHTINSSRASD
jgi:UDP-3-O-[3-hydroxymyristoyl] glucosamine N-acyltransferase